LASPEEARFFIMQTISSTSDLYELDGEGQPSSTAEQQLDRLQSSLLPSTSSSSIGVSSGQPHFSSESTSATSTPRGAQRKVHPYSLQPLKVKLNFDSGIAFDFDANPVKVICCASLLGSYQLTGVERPSPECVPLTSLMQDA